MIKRYLTSVIVIVSLSLIFVSPAFISSAIAERINSYSTDVIVEQSGSIKVKEKIDYDFESAEKHGIFRDIPLVVTNADGKRFAVDVSNVAVTDEVGDQLKWVQSYEISSGKKDLRLKIGDANLYVTGLKTYIISYSVKGGLRYFSDHDELYWNVLGSNWDVPVDTFSSIITIPVVQNATEPIQSINGKCYVGVAGSTDTSRCNHLVTGQTVKFEASNLSPGEGVTAVVGFPKGIVQVIEPKPYDGEKLTLIQILLAAVFIFGALWWYLIYPIWIVVKWIKYGRDPYVGKDVQAYYEAPKTKKGRHLTPAETGTLVDEKADTRDILAIIVDLARRGHLIIEKNGKKFSFVKKTAKSANKDKLQDFELTLFSGIFKSADRIEVAMTDLSTTVIKVTDTLYTRLVADEFFPQPPQKIRDFYTVIGVLALTTANPFLTISAFIFGRSMARKTLFGAQQAAKARALMNFLRSQERQLAFQANAQMMFEKLLPFAIVFGVEKIWMDRFADIQLTQPSWYVSDSGEAFTSSTFSRGLHASLLGQMQQAATPTRSSSGFSSGFSGGSSGGGGGGGGGGSW